MTRERTYQTEAIILRRRNWGEADRILTLFTPYRGKIRARAVGVRKPRSRKAGHLELFHRSTLFLAKGRDLDIVTQAETIESFRILREDLVRSAAASYLVELLDRLSPEEVDNLAAYRLLKAALKAVCRTENLPLILRCYEIKLLDSMGYRPELTHCTVGREEIRPEDQFISPARGGAVCPRCAGRADSLLAISLASLRVLRHLQRASLEECFRLRVRGETLEELRDILNYYIQYIVESPLRSRGYFEEVSRLRQSGGV
jgi:DNA repair protein RecO (recombination protein O)